MELKTANDIIAFLEGYNKHFSELVGFLAEKEHRILDDDLVWLTDSLTEEQRLIERGTTLENQRLALFEKKGLKDATSDILIGECPEERKGQMTLQCKNLENAVIRIKRLNDSSLDLVERKLTILAQTIGAPEFTHIDTYTGNCEKVKHSVGDIIGSV